MELKQTITVSLKTDDVYFELFEVESVENGTMLRAKSKKFGQWLKGLKKTRAFNGIPAEVWKNGTFYLPQVNLEGTEGRILCSPSYDLFADGQANMVWLFHGDLEVGWELLLPVPMSFNNLEDFFTTSVDTLRDLYIAHLRAGKLSAQLSEVVDEPHR